MVKLALTGFVLHIYGIICLHETDRGKFLNVNYIYIGFKSALYFRKEKDKFQRVYNHKCSKKVASRDFLIFTLV